MPFGIGAPRVKVARLSGNRSFEKKPITVGRALIIRKGAYRKTSSRPKKKRATTPPPIAITMVLFTVLIVWPLITVAAKSSNKIAAWIRILIDYHCQP